MVAASYSLAVKAGLKLFHKDGQAYEIIWTFGQSYYCNQNPKQFSGVFALS